MKRCKLWQWGLIIALITFAGGAINATSLFPTRAQAVAPATNPPASAQMVTRAAPIIIDHTTTDLSQIPPYWIEQAKALLRLSYGHTSHGSQPISGMGVLESGSLNIGGLYDFNTNGAIQVGILSLADYTPSGDLGNPDRETWAARTRTYLDGTGSNRNVVIWSWCGQADTTADNINLYLNLMNSLEQDYPQVTFVYMTGHLTGTGETGNLHQRNEQIRNYCRANNKVLFDFADIESYDPDGNYFLDRGADDECNYNGGNWATQWCNAHPSDPLCESCSCAHSQPLNCNLKARAFWWMLARLAGWSGPGESSKSASVITTTFGQPVTYTVVIQNLAAPPTVTITMSDTLPAGLQYSHDTLTATAGAWDDSAAPTLTWNGVLSPTRVVTITYVAHVATNTAQFITNTAVVDAGEQQTLELTAIILVNGYTVYLPIVLK